MTDDLQMLSVSAMYPGTAYDLPPIPTSGADTPQALVAVTAASPEVPYMATYTADPVFASPSSFNIPASSLVTALGPTTTSPRLQVGYLPEAPSLSTIASDLDLAMNAPEMGDNAAFVDSMFTGLIQTLQSARDAYLQGHANTLHLTLDQVQRNVHVIRGCLTPEQPPAPSQPAQPPAPVISPTARAAISPLVTPPRSLQRTPTFADYANSSTTIPSNHEPPPTSSTAPMTSDLGSRKRCASALEEDRASKIVKLEPSPPSLHLPHPPPLVHAHSYAGSHALNGSASLSVDVPYSKAAIESDCTPTASLPMPHPLMSSTDSAISFPSRSSSGTSLHRQYPFAHQGPGPPLTSPLRATIPIGFMETYDHSRPSTGTYSVPQSPDDTSSDSDDDSWPDGEAHLRIRPRGAGHRRVGSAATSGELSSFGGHGSDVPPELRSEVDRVFFEYLNRICSDLNATDKKGELIHQTLMAKKMQRLDESTDFRPFKFRIQAFTRAFLEELERQGYPEDRIPHKKVRNYLWTNPYIARWNQDGKKTKSKGNHVWNVDAKKFPDGRWLFRQFHRKIAGDPPAVAYVGVTWTWAPKVWDPQQQSKHGPLVEWTTAEILPKWIKFEKGVFEARPEKEQADNAEKVEITVIAKITSENREPEELRHTFELTVAPMMGDGTFMRPRRASVSSDGPNPRRVMSDSIVPTSTSTIPRPVPARMQTAIGAITTTPAPAPVAASENAQVVKVMQVTAQRVATAAAQAQAHALHMPTDVNVQLHEQASFAKQRHVLAATAEAFDVERKIMSGQRSPSSGSLRVNGESEASVLVAAAQQIVHQAARKVLAQHEVMAAMSMLPAAAAPPTVNEVSVVTQDAVAQAVAITGPAASDAEVLMTANALVSQPTRTLPSLVPTTTAPLSHPPTFAPLPTTLSPTGMYIGVGP